MQKFFQFWYRQIAYFFYIGWHWNFRLAAFISYHEIAGEKKYGIVTTGIDTLHTSVAQQDLKSASIYQPVNYFIAEWLFEQIQQDAITQGAFLDAGCGMGRSMAVAAHKGFKKISGIDISPAMCHKAIANCERLQQTFPDTHFEVTCINALHYEIPDDVTVVFLFNPFNGVIMEGFLAQLDKSIKRKPRKVQILYANPEYRDIIGKYGFRIKRSLKKMEWLQGSVFSNEPA